MNPSLFLLKNECGISVAFKQGLVSCCCLDSTTRLFPVLTKTSGNTQPLGLSRFPEDRNDVFPMCLYRVCHV